MTYIKKIMLIAFALSFSIKSFADIKDCLPLKEENGRVLTLLSYLNEVDMEKTYLTRDEKGNMIYDFAQEKALVDSIDSPMEMAKAIVLSYILQSGGIEHIALDRHYCVVDIPCMEKFKEHKDFLEAMALIERHLRLDAGSAYMFSEVLWAARDSAGVRHKYKDRIAQVENGILKNGRPEKKEALKEEIKKRLIKEGKVRYLYGDLEGAKRKFLDLQVLDAQSKEAETYLALIEKKEKNPSYKDSYVVHKFSDSSIYKEKDIDESDFICRDNFEEHAEIQPLSQKDLAKIIIPALNFQDCTVKDLLNTLHRIVSKNDISYVNFALLRDLPENKISLRLYDISLKRALDLISQQSDCTYYIEGNTVIFKSKEE